MNFNDYKSAKALAYADKNFTKNIDTLKDLVKISSVSFPGYDPKDVIKCADKCVEVLTEAGLNNVQKINYKESAPFVFGEILVDPKLPTVLLYAHYDVQPEMRSEFWESPAFEPEIRNGRLYGRGAADDKAGVILHSASIEAFTKTNDLPPVNLKVIFEGEEEVASPGLEGFIEEYRDLLEADTVIVADMVNYQVGTPAITTSLRGMIAVEVEVKALKTPLHSGMWGGPLPDPAMELTKIISKLTDDNHQITIPEFYEMIETPSDLEIESYKNLNLDARTFREQSGLLESNDLLCKNDEILLKLWREPSLIVSAIQSGDRKTAGNVLMDSAWARIGVRLAPGMSQQKCLDLMIKKIEDISSVYKTDGCKLEVKITAEQGGADPWSCSSEHPYFLAAQESLSQAYPNPAVFVGCGATIPFVGSLCEKLGGIPAILVGVEDPDSKAHSENESVHLEDLKNSVLAQVIFFEKLAELK